MKPWLFLLFLSIASDIIAAAVGSWIFWKHRNGAGIRWALLYAGIFLRGMGELCANAFGFEVRPVYTLGYAVTYWVTRGIYCGCVWQSVLYLSGGRKLP